MSLILEALRKSEAERRRGDMPDLRAELPPVVPAPQKPLHRALPWLIAIVAIGFAAVLVLLLHPWSRDTTTASIASPATTIPAPAETVRLQPRLRTPAATGVETSRIAEREAPKPLPPPAPVAPPAPEPPPPSVATADMQETSINALPADQRKALPPLQLSMHMWDPDPAKRFVILDGERYAEGDSVGPMRIRRIDAGGVLFDWQGRSVRLPLR